MQVVFLILSLILIVLLEFIAIPIIILLYVILSVANNKMGKKV
jgi:CDP-diacylglycerol--serine O-phosphatidyltransferase